MNAVGAHRMASLASKAMVAGLLLAALVATPAAATWSIVATDPETGEVGVGIASCVPAEILGDEPDQPLVPVVLVPGRAAAVTQGQLNLAAPGRITELVEAGASAGEVVAELSSPTFDEQAELRQHAVSDLGGNEAAYTGAGTSAEALDRQGANVSVQGNLLAGPNVVNDSLSQFVITRSEGADLATALADGLAAGSRAGGDRRCGRSQTALFAQVAVAGSGTDVPQPELLLTVVVDESDGQNPVELLVSSLAAGDRGLVDRRSATPGWRSPSRVAVVAAGLVMAAGGVVVFRRGLGSRQARR
jgi:uncharacterized Ntn-hydrolase superfamily protein